MQYGIAHIGKGIVLHRPSLAVPQRQYPFRCRPVEPRPLSIAAEARGGSAVGLQGGLPAVDHGRQRSARDR